MGKTMDLGPVIGPQGQKGVSMRLKGAWTSGTAYVNDGNYIDIVTNSGNTYGCIKSHAASSTIPVTDTTYWQLLASKGAKGDIGAAGIRGSQLFYGTGITGTSTTATIFAGSGVSSALVGDKYINTSTGALYNCTVAGNASVAKWVYVGSVKGPKGDTGAKGDKGDTGDIGPQGPAGPTPTFSINESGHLIMTI